MSNGPKVVDLARARVELSHDQQEILKVLRIWTEKVERGEITGIGICGAYRDGHVSHALPPSDDFIRVIAACHLMARKSTDECMSDRGEDPDFSA